MTVSCSRGPAPLKQPSINASSAGKLAMEQYDKDGDGKVAGAELDQAPASRPHSRISIRHGDGGVSAARSGSSRQCLEDDGNSDSRPSNVASRSMAKR